MDIVLLSGWSGSGKDFVANIFELYGFTKLSFAGELKKIIAHKYNIPLELTQTQEGKRQIIPSVKKSVRNILIQEGQEIRKEKGYGYFAECVAQTIIDTSLKRVVISDWRFPVELETLKNQLPKERFHTIRILRVDQQSSPILDMYTENQLDFFAFNYYFENPGVYSMNNSLYNQIKKFFVKIDIPCDVETDDGIGK